MIIWGEGMKCTCKKCGKTCEAEEDHNSPDLVEDLGAPENTTDELLEYELEEAPQSE
jgi:hypothetical protein